MLIENKAVSLKTVAAKVGLAPCSVSAILNHTEAARAIPQSTKNRVYRAAAELNYRPNFMARSLRTKRTRMVAVIAPALDRFGIASIVMAAQRRLHERGYMLVLAGPDECDHMCAEFQQRGIEGVVAIDIQVPPQLKMPVILIDFGRGTFCTQDPAQMQTCRADLGESAAEAVIKQIENEKGSRRLTIQAALPSIVELAGIRPVFSAAESA